MSKGLFLFCAIDYFLSATLVFPAEMLSMGVFICVLVKVLTTTGLSALMLCFNYLLQVPYPNNLLRNVGRSILPSEAYILVVDVDMMCNGDLYSSFLEYAQHINPMANKGIEKRGYLFVMRM